MIEDTIWPISLVRLGYVGRSFDVQVFPADVVDGLVVHHEGAVGVLEGGVGREDRVVRLDHSSGHSEGRLGSSEPSSEEFDRNICSD